MKRKISALITAFCLALLCGCDKNDPQTSPAVSDGTESSPQHGGESGPESGGSPDGGGESEKPVFADFVGEYPENPIPILTLSEEEIRGAIEAQPNFRCTDALYINIPESASVYEYRTYYVHVPQFEYPSEQFLKDLEAAFDYLFPDREMNMDCLSYDKYLGYDHEAGEPLYENGFVKDTDALPDQITLTYDEMPERTEVWNDPVYIEIPYEIGSGGGEINKGEAARLAGKVEYGLDGPMPSDTYLPPSSLVPNYYFESVGRYSPQSEKSFKLLDGEMRICDAVKFAEDYINNIPISTGLARNVYTGVYYVEVLRLDDDTYGYYFQTEPRFGGVNYDPAVGGSGLPSYEYDPIYGEAFMVRSDDVDHISGIHASAWTFDIKPCSEVVPVDAAIKTVGEELTEGVVFDVISVEFVYVQQFEKDDRGYVNIDTYEAKVTPAWRITAGNSNDGRTYICYVDAEDGGNFRYFSSSGITYYDD